MPFDLPDKTLAKRPPSAAASWGKALNYRDFQDKTLRIFQYGARGIAYYLLQSDPNHVLGTKLFNLYKGLSLSRKAFRSFRSLADLLTAATKARTIAEKPVAGVLGTLQWVLLSVHIFWDNMFFLTHPIVAVIDRPDSPWFNNDATNQHQKNWRAMSDTTGLVLAYRTWSSAGRAVATAQAAHRQAQDSPGALAAAAAEQSAAALSAAKDKKREAWWSMLKLVADVATYFPQCAWMTWTRWSNKHGYHDGYIGVAGVVAAVCSCRSEWIKMN